MQYEGVDWIQFAGENFENTGESKNTKMLESAQKRIIRATQICEAEK
jgi:hypothetical protein